MKCNFLECNYFFLSFFFSSTAFHAYGKPGKALVELRYAIYTHANTPHTHTHTHTSHTHTHTHTPTVLPPRVLNCPFDNDLIYWCLQKHWRMANFTAAHTHTHTHTHTYTHTHAHTHTHIHTHRHTHPLGPVISLNHVKMH